MVKEVRGLGFMIGIEIKKKNSNIVKDCIDKGLILNLFHSHWPELLMLTVNRLAYTFMA